MEKFFKKIEEKFEKQMDDFENSPIKTSLKWIIIIYIIKWVWKNWIKDEGEK